MLNHPALVVLCEDVQMVEKPPERVDDVYVPRRQDEAKRAFAAIMQLGLNLGGTITGAHRQGDRRVGLTYRWPAGVPRVDVA